MQTIVDDCGCHASKRSKSRDRGLISSLPIPYGTNSLLSPSVLWGSIFPKLIETQVECVNVCLNLTTT